MNVKKLILDILSDNKISFEHFEHDKSSSSIEAALARGSNLSDGAKSILLKAKGSFCIFSIRAHLEIDSNKVRKILAVNKLRFASDNELLSLCNVQKGALAPLVSKLYNLPHFIDKSLLTGEKIAFNIGVLDESVIISTKDFLSLIDATTCEVAKE